MTKERKPRIDVHQHITDQIITALEAGVDQFKLPWNRPAGSITRPKNIASGQLYRWINVVTLWVEAQVRGFSTPVFGTYKQWQEAGCQVRRGEKASLVVFYKEYKVMPEARSSHDAKPEQDGDERKRWVAKGYWVFSAEQVDDYEMPEVPDVSPIERNTKVDRFLTATGADVRHGGQSAHYDVKADHIQMPDEGLFIGTDTSGASEAYYSTLLHETCHWTGHKSRLDRDLGLRFGKGSYAAEELIAELGAAFLCADPQVTPSLRDDHAQYIDHWLNIMKADKKAIFTAAAKANQALEYLHGLQVAEAA